MNEDELKGLSIDELLKLAEKALALYVAASIDPHTKNLAEMRKDDLNVIYKVINEKRPGQTPLE